MIINIFCLLFCSLISASAGMRAAWAVDTDPGALIEVTMESRVGVLLDNFPENIRDRVARTYLQKDASFWRSRAIVQIEATYYRLIYRNFYYDDKGQLPLPPQDVWKIILSPARRMKIDGHDLIVSPYVLKTYLVSPLNSAEKAEPRLGRIGGTWREPFVLPADPELLFEHTGYACMNEEDYPPNSVDTENARFLYDHTCEAGVSETSTCHVVTPAPTVSCIEALRKNVGRVSTNMVFRRVAWNANIANNYRVGSPSPGGANLKVLRSGIENNRLIYRYIEPNSCAIQEGCVAKAGWRRLLQFDASLANDGDEAVEFGDVTQGSPLLARNNFEFSACHGHLHFSHYGEFNYGTFNTVGTKRAFCLESTSRYQNNESTPLTHPYGCLFQGIEKGWGDDYIAGIECQWIDVTDVPIPGDSVTAPLIFRANPDKFMCEGKVNRDPAGEMLFEPTQFVTADGLPVDRISCDFKPNYEADNKDSAPVVLPKEGGLLTEDCSRGQDTHLRNCGFKKLGGVRPACTPGSTVELTCQISSGQPQVVRACEYSSVLGQGTACILKDALGQGIIDSRRPKRVRVQCPSARDSDERGGKYVLYSAPVHVGDPAVNIICR